MSSLILIMGRKRTGKDTLARGILQGYPAGNAVLVRLSDPLKLAAAGFLGMTASTDEATLKQVDAMKESGENLPAPFSHLDMRQFLEFFGDTIREKFGQDIFPKMLTEDLTPLRHDLIVIPDCRTEDEILILGKWAEKNGVSTSIIAMALAGDERPVTHPTDLPPYALAQQIFSFPIGRAESIETLGRSVGRQVMEGTR